MYADRKKTLNRPVLIAITLTIVSSFTFYYAADAAYRLADSLNQEKELASYESIYGTPKK